MATLMEIVGEEQEGRLQVEVRKLEVTSRSKIRA